MQIKCEMRYHSSGVKSKWNCVIRRTSANIIIYTVWLQSIWYGYFVGLTTCSGSPQFTNTHTHTRKENTLLAPCRKKAFLQKFVALFAWLWMHFLVNVAANESLVSYKFPNWIRCDVKATSASRPPLSSFTWLPHFVQSLCYELQIFQFFSPWDTCLLC